MECEGGEKKRSLREVDDTHPPWIQEGKEQCVLLYILKDPSIDPSTTSNTHVSSPLQPAQSESPQSHVILTLKFNLNTH